MLKHAARLAIRRATSGSSNSASASACTAESVCSTSGRTHQAAACTWRLQSWRWHGSSSATSSETISVTFYDGKDNSEKTVQVPLGQSLLEAAHSNDIDLEGKPVFLYTDFATQANQVVYNAGACEGSLACSTCHVIVEDQEKFDLLPEADDDENDMLDLAFALTDTSRLGCQIIAAPELDGLKVRIPSATRNFAVDGYVPKPH